MQHEGIESNEQMVKIIMTDSSSLSLLEFFLRLKHDQHFLGAKMVDWLDLLTIGSFLDLHLVYGLKYMLLVLLPEWLNSFATHNLSV